MQRRDPEGEMFCLVLKESTCQEQTGKKTATLLELQLNKQNSEGCVESAKKSQYMAVFVTMTNLWVCANTPQGPENA